MLRLIRYLALALAGAATLITVAWWMARPVTPDAFYATPAGPPTQPGELLRQEAFDRGLPAHAQGWRILYATTRHDGSAAVASAIVVMSGRPHDGPRPLVAWTHGTTGVAPGCAPSLLAEPFANVPALGEALANGWVIVATDYAGLGTAGPHAYLVGEDEARSALDSIRAARRMKEPGLGPGVVVWGHSQGGHAALWAGILAPAYAPDAGILGVAAVAPASDLRQLLETVRETTVGRIMSSFVLRSYSQAYGDVASTDYPRPAVRALAQDMSGRCLAGRQALFSVVEALVSGGDIFGADPTRGPLGERLAQNTPLRSMPQPVLLAQGLADDLVRPQVQARFVQQLCRTGQVLAYRTYAGRDHLSIVAPQSPLASDLLRWTQDRFNGASAPSTCG